MISVDYKLSSSLMVVSFQVEEFAKDATPLLSEWPWENSATVGNTIIVDRRSDRDDDDDDIKNRATWGWDSFIVREI